MRVGNEGSNEWVWSHYEWWIYRWQESRRSWGKLVEVSRCCSEVRLLIIDRLYYYGPGTRFRASRPFDRARSIAFRTFLNHFLCLVWLLCFFFQLSWKHSQCLVMCSSNVGTGKSPDLSDFHPCPSRQSLAIAPGQYIVVLTWAWAPHSKGDIQEEQSISRKRKNVSLDNKKPE